MRVLYLSPAAGLGGAERCLLDFVSAVHGHDGVTAEVITLADGPLVEKLRALGARTTVVRAPENLAALGESGSGAESRSALLGLLSATPDVVRFVTELRRAIAFARADVVHSNGMKAHLLAGLLAPARSQLVIHLHDFIGARRASRWLLPALRQVRRRAVFVANSRAVAVDFATLSTSADIRTLYNVVDTDYFCEGPSEPQWLAKEAGLAPPSAGGTAFGLVATYARWKGHGLFIEAAGLLKQAAPDSALRFYVVGGPIYETRGSQVSADELLTQARAAGIEAELGLVPFQDDIARVYRSLDVMVHSSTQPEPFGRTIVEAMACARPVIVARAGGAAELFDDGVNALGYEPGNAKALAHAMRRDLDAIARAGMGRAARHHAVARFGHARLGPELLRIYTR